LIELLARISFQVDKQSGLHQALAELDEDGDGFIKIEELSDMMKNLGEPLSEEEALKFRETVLKLPGNKPDLINVLELSKLFLPDLEAEVEAKMIGGEEGE